MKKFFWLFVFVFLFTINSSAAFVRSFPCTALTGGAVGALDYYKTAQIHEGDTTHCNVGGQVFHFRFDADGTGAENTATHPYTVRPDDYLTSGVWIEQEVPVSGGDNISIDGVAVTDPDFVSTGDIDFVDTSNTVTANINADKVDDTHINWGSGPNQIDMSDFPASGSWSPTGTIDLSGATMTFGIVDADVPDDITITESDPNALLTAGTDNVKDTHVDWGSGANQVSIADVPANNWKVLYSNGSGVITELALGASGEVLTSNGASSAPSFQATGTGGGSLWTDDGTYIYADTQTGFKIYDDGSTLLNPSVSSNIVPFYVNTSESLSTGATFHITSALKNTSTGTGNRETLHVEAVSSTQSPGRFLVGITGIGRATGGSGNVFGLNGYAWIDSGVASSAEAVGMEANTDVRATVARKAGIQAIDVASSTASGSTYDAGLIVGKQPGAAGYRYGIQLGVNAGGGGNAAQIYHWGSNFIYDCASGTHYWRVGGSNKMSLSSGGVLNTTSQIAAPTITATSMFQGPDSNGAARIRGWNGHYIGFKWQGSYCDLYVNGINVGRFNTL